MDAALEARIKSLEDQAYRNQMAWAFEGSAQARSAFRLAESRASRAQDRAGAESALAQGLRYVDGLRGRQSQYLPNSTQGNILYSLVGALDQQANLTRRVIDGHLARPPEQQQRYRQGIEDSDRSHQRYVEYSDTRRDWTRDVEAAWEETKADANRLARRAQELALEAVGIQTSRSFWLVGGLLVGVGGTLYLLGGPALANKARKMLR